MSTSGTTASSLFSGNSRYASDFQAVIDRTVAIASLPVSLLDKNKTTLTDRSTALTALDTRFGALATAIQSVSDALTSTSYQAAVSDPSAVSATIGEGVAEGTYSIKVLGLGSYTTALSPPPDGTVIKKVADPATSGLASAANFALTVDGKPHTITPASRTLSALAEAINADSDANVHATVVNVGSSGDPDYRLSVQSDKLGPVAISLQADATALLEEQARGTQATYNVNGAKVNGEDLVASSDSRTVQIAPGLTVSLIKPGSSPVDITVTRQSSAVSDALSGLVTAYNAAADELDKHRGQAGGALSGQAIVSSLSRTLQDLTSYTASGAVSSLNGLGLNFDQNGRLSFNSLGFMAADITSPAAITTFLGTAGADGFLHAAAVTLDAVERPATGELKSEMASVQQEISDVDSHIADQQLHIEQLQSNLMAQMAAADAMIAAMEQQYNYISSMFSAMQSASDSFK